ncbi:hypothetical protein TeGR_g5339 [Tetraparma gracilis]|uniref:Uncharacterized protein n=1 Tax=Tetraparma gracilis TaxID=2962635 RepID=A0ABQ6N2X2_9STRA|nr:hypothetical protein TeGR_g5339 [Tetraparma gracilis]
MPPPASESSETKNDDPSTLNPIRRRLALLWPYGTTTGWKLVFLAGAAYVLTLSCMLMLPFKEARSILEWVIGDIGSWDDYVYKTEFVKTDVMGSCYIDRHNFASVLWKQVFGAPWFLSHALGWTGKMIVFRDWKVCFVAALFFEFTEMSLAYVCPEFEECWWDSIFLDTFGANVLGMWIGTRCNKFAAAYVARGERAGRANRAKRGERVKRSERTERSGTSERSGASE